MNVSLSPTTAAPFCARTSVDRGVILHFNGSNSSRRIFEFVKVLADIISLDAFPVVWSMITHDDVPVVNVSLFGVYVSVAQVFATRS